MLQVSEARVSQSVLLFFLLFFTVSLQLLLSLFPTGNPLCQSTLLR